MSYTKVDINALSSTITGILKEYEKVTEENVTRAVDKTARETVANIKGKAPGKGAYRKSWGSKVTTKGGRGVYGRTVYSKKPGLPHLLENGHEIRGYMQYRTNKTRTRAFQHVQQDDATEELFEKHLREEVARNG